MNRTQFDEIITIKEGLYLEDLNLKDINVYISLILASYNSSFFHLYSTGQSNLNCIQYSFDNNITFINYKTWNSSLVLDDYYYLLSLLNTYKIHFYNSDYYIIALLKKRGLDLKFDHSIISKNHILTHLDL